MPSASFEGGSRPPQERFGSIQRIQARKAVDVSMVFGSMPCFFLLDDNSKQLAFETCRGLNVIITQVMFEEV
ncbi:hypothetical protein VN24_08840 [Paenibacillus beijingensis]|uniref:Uncharacterized protein n=1 Tax=Paenibacillus beijingensis TaxID=1126833 RepID=A0A0D5NHU6_9BACL|nr:hypothetical protein VN24_08840 [Paenibacillus beijingensis]